MASDLENFRCDILSGGFPCQDISVAGEGLGIDLGIRSGLWREFARLIRLLRPKYAFVENVAALLDGDIGRVLGDLAEIGYDAEWDSLPAAAFGAPHLRDRLFCVAYPNGQRCVHGQLEGQSAETWLQTQRHAGASRNSGQIRGKAGILADVADAHSARFADIQGRATSAERTRNGAAGNHRWWDIEPELGRVVDGIRNRMDIPRIKALGNSIVPQIAEWIGRRIVTHADASLSGLGTQSPLLPEEERCVEKKI